MVQPLSFSSSPAVFVCVSLCAEVVAVLACVVLAAEQQLHSVSCWVTSMAKVATCLVTLSAIVQLEVYIDQGEVRLLNHCDESAIRE